MQSNSNKNKQILISLYLLIHLQYKLINGRTRKHINPCLILIYLKIYISGQFTPPIFKALKNKKKHVKEMHANIFIFQSSL